MVAFPFITFVSSVAFSDKWTMKNRQGLHQTCMSCRIRSDVCGQPGAPTACTWEKAPCQHSFSSTRRFHITLCRVWKGEERKVYHDTSVLPDFLPKLRWILTLLPLNKLLVIALILKIFASEMGTSDVCWIWNINQISFQGPLPSCIIPSYPVFPLTLPQSMSFVSGRPDSPDTCPALSYLSEEKHQHIILSFVWGKTSAYFPWL